MDVRGKQLEKIHPADKTAMEAALAHWNNIAMPLHSLGRLQDTVVRIAGMTGNARVDLKKKSSGGHVRR